ncbi:MAG: amidohydrolase family protein, partial [Oscillospiraceae bacterium]|nr:amidohydrolase family protein [Oscillospiraceae bacterium]
MANRARSGFVEFPCKKLDVHTHLATMKNERGMFTAEERMEFDRFYGVDKCVLLPAGASIPGVPAMPGMMTSEDACEISRKYPEHFTWFCNVNPDGTEATCEQLRRYKELGAKGVGEFGGLKRFDDPVMEHMFACCEELGLPILFHMSPNGINYGVIDEAGLPLLEGALKKFPKLVFIGHSQPFWFEISEYPPELTAEERNIYPRGKVTPGRVPYLLEKYPNLYADLSADSGGNALL